VVYVCRLYESLPENIFSLFMMATGEEKKKRILKQKNRRKAEAMLVGEVLAKLAVKEQFEINIESQKFEKSKTGKPYLSGYPDVHFSISHSGDIVVCAVSSSSVGIDVEKIKRVKESVKEKVSLQSELERIKDSDEEFIKLWTQKEAVVKKYGTGIAGGDFKNCLKNEKVTSKKFEDYIISVSY